MPRDDETFGFNREDAEEILRFTGGREKAWMGRRGGGGGGDRIVHCKTPVGGIPAMATLTMGSASCDKYVSSSAGVLSDSGSDVTVYNDLFFAIPASTFIKAAYNDAGLLVVLTAGIVNLRLSGTTLQYTFDGTAWVTWHTGTECP